MVQISKLPLRLLQKAMVLPGGRVRRTQVGERARGQLPAAPPSGATL